MPTIRARIKQLLCDHDYWEKCRSRDHMMAICPKCRARVIVNLSPTICRLAAREWFLTKCEVGEEMKL